MENLFFCAVIKFEYSKIFLGNIHDFDNFDQEFF